MEVHLGADCSVWGLLLNTSPDLSFASLSLTQVWRPYPLSVHLSKLYIHHSRIWKDEELGFEFWVCVFLTQFSVGYGEYLAPPFNSRSTKAEALCRQGISFLMRFWNFFLKFAIQKRIRANDFRFLYFSNLEFHLPEFIHLCVSFTCTHIHHTHSSLIHMSLYNSLAHTPTHSYLLRMISKVVEIKSVDRLSQMRLSSETSDHHISLARS